MSTTEAHDTTFNSNGIPPPSNLNLPVCNGFPAMMAKLRFTSYSQYIERPEDITANILKLTELVEDP